MTSTQQQKTKTVVTCYK